jgi:hypothetical protein
MSFSSALNIFRLAAHSQANPQQVNEFAKGMEQLAQGLIAVDERIQGY